MQRLLVDRFSSDLVLSSAEDRAFFGKDSCRQFAGNASVVFLPRTIAHVQEFLSFCQGQNLAVVPSGGRTGYSGGATAMNGEVVLSLARLNKISEVDVVGQTLVCEAGATTEAVRRKAADAGLQYPVDFASKGSSHIGGNIATNAGGIRVIRYGSTRDWVLGMKVVTAEGALLDINGSLFKNATGPDLRGLFIGSEGTLGVIVEATLRLTSAAKESSLALAGLARVGDAPLVLRDARRAGLTINVIEYFERNALELVTQHTGLRDPFAAPHVAYVLLEVETAYAGAKEVFERFIMELVEHGVVSDAVVAANEKQREELMGLRERISETIGRTRVPHKNDVSVPVAAVPDFLSAYRACLQQHFPEFEVIVFGHIGDGNLHLNVLKPAAMEEGEFFRRCDDIDEKTFAVVSSLQGSISAEHGVGLLKKKYLHLTRSAAEIALMKNIKQQLDPQGILNPGKIFD